MAATLVGALLGVMVGQILLTALAKPLGLPQFATVIAVMLGLGAGIDYSLLIIGRYREQVAARRHHARRLGQGGRHRRRVRGRRRPDRHGGDRRPAGDRHPADRQARHRRGDRRRRRRRVRADDPADHDRRAGALAAAQDAEHVQPSPRFERWGELDHAPPVGRRSPPASLVLLVFAAPVTQLRLGQPDDGNQPTSKTQRVAYDQLSAAFGPGSNGPFLLAVDTPKGDAQTEGAARSACSSAVGDTPGIATVVAARRPARTARWRRSSPSRRPRRRTRATSDLLERLREDVIPAPTAGTPLKVYVGGNTAGFEDFSDKVASRLPLFIAVVIGLSRAAADRRLPLAVGPARLGGLQPAVGRRRLRRRGRRLPGGRRREPRRRRQRRARSCRSSR